MGRYVFRSRSHSDREIVLRESEIRISKASHITVPSLTIPKLFSSVLVLFLGMALHTRFIKSMNMARAFVKSKHIKEFIVTTASP